MEILKAKKTDLDIIKYICDTTINKIYPKYYPKGAVDFFINHHSLEHIKADIKNGFVHIIKDEDKIIGTVTVKNNNMNRLFVLPEYHKKGYGKALITFAEEMIFKKYDSIIIDASLPSKSLYLKIGFKEIEYDKILTDNGDYLCYGVMKKEKLN
ncbi:MAG: GNAT family N-acetyltransferase [bacterium]|nr:GNAT family N-acetyltransferase [bacterium]